jgi:hypothetical protein
VIEPAIDYKVLCEEYKVLYEKISEQNLVLQHELANLKRLIFDNKNERFVPVNDSTSRLALCQ